MFVVTDGTSYVAGYYTLGDVRMPYLTASREEAKVCHTRLLADVLANAMGKGWQVEPRYLQPVEF